VLFSRAFATETPETAFQALFPRENTHGGIPGRSGASRRPKRLPVAFPRVLPAAFPRVLPAAFPRVLPPSTGAIAS